MYVSSLLNSNSPRSIHLTAIILLSIYDSTLWIVSSIELQSLIVQARLLNVPSFSKVNSHFDSSPKPYSLLEFFLLREHSYLVVGWVNKTRARAHQRPDYSARYFSNFHFPFAHVHLVPNNDPAFQANTNYPSYPD